MKHVLVFEDGIINLVRQTSSASQFLNEFMRTALVETLSICVAFRWASEKYFRAKPFCPFAW